MYDINLITLPADQAEKLIKDAAAIGVMRQVDDLIGAIRELKEHLTLYAAKYVTHDVLAKHFFRHANNEAVVRYIKTQGLPYTRKVGWSYIIKMEDFYKWLENQPVSNQLENPMM